MNKTTHCISRILNDADKSNQSGALRDVRVARTWSAKVGYGKVYMSPSLH